MNLTGPALLAALIGMLIGSFLNVVISRGPRLWGLVEDDGKPAGLAAPSSRCEGCGRPLRVHELVPVLSYLAQRGRCRSCSAPIGSRHLLVELLGGAIGFAAVVRYGLDTEAVAAVVLLFLLLALAVIDWETGYLPDALTIPLLAAGILAAFLGIGPSPAGALIGAAIGGVGLWALATGYRRLRGREGLGGGDVKLVAAAGAWVGWTGLPFVLLSSSLAGLVFALVLMARGRRERDLGAAIRFGPFLAGGTGLVYLVGTPLAFAS